MTTENNEPKQNCKYNCVCGFGTDSVPKFTTHFVTVGRKEPGMHKSLKVKTVPAVVPAAVPIDIPVVNKPVEEVKKDEVERQAPAQTQGITQSQIKFEQIKLDRLKDNKPKTKLNVKKMALLFASGFIILLSFWMISLYAQDQRANMILGAFGAVMFMAGGAGIFFGLKSGESLTVKNQTRAAAGVINSLVISRDFVGFTQLQQDEMPTFQARKCRNDSKPYYVFKETGGVRERFVLPDTTYRDPREVANYLNIPAHRRLAMREASLLQKIAPWAIVLAMVGVFIFGIATSPAPSQQVVPPTQVQGELINGK
jgi:hypothetical protein